jgi:hypothetical protein
MKTIIKKGELLSRLDKVDEELFKDCLEEIFWEDVDSAFIFDSTSLRIDWKDNIPVRIIVELADEEYDTANCLTIVTFILSNRKFISYITGIQKFYDNYFENKYTTQAIDKNILERVLDSYIGSLRKYSDEMDWGTSNENNFFE